MGRPCLLTWQCGMTQNAKASVTNGFLWRLSQPTTSLARPQKISFADYYACCVLFFHPEPNQTNKKKNHQRQCKLTPFRTEQMWLWKYLIQLPSCSKRSCYWQQEETFYVGRGKNKKPRSIGVNKCVGTLWFIIYPLGIWFLQNIKPQRCLSLTMT